MARRCRVNVYDGNNNIIARVRYNQNLDFWDGRNWQNGGPCRHKGITKLKDGRYVIIIGTDWQGERDHAYVVNAHEALQEILKSGNIELLETKKFAELKKLYQELELEDDDDLELEEEATLKY